MKKTTEKPTEKPSAQPLEETCEYCGRVLWGNYQYLTRGHWRHEECIPGSEDWREWYARNPERHTTAGDFLYNHKGGK